jgi:hypothetical protein
MSPPPIRVRGIRTPIPTGHALARVSPGTGDVELVDFGTIAALVAQSGQVAVPSSISPPPMLVAPAAGLTITPSGSTFTFALANDLAALEAMSGTGLVARTASETYAQRTITGTASRLSVSNGSGVAGNPTLDIDTGYVGQTSITTLGTIATGVWNGTAIPVLYGGTGQTSYTNGQLLIGNTTGNTLAKSTLTAGSNVTITNGAGTITIAATGGSGGTGLFGQVLSATPTSASTGLGTWLNQGSATISDGTTGMALSQTTTNDSAARYGAVPGTPYTITALISLLAADAGGTNNPSVGIGWTDATKLHVMYIVIAGGTAGPFITVTRMTNSTTFSANDYAQARFYHSHLMWMKLNDDGTNVSFAISNDGANYLTVYTVAKASGFLGGSGYTNLCLSVRGASGGAGNTIGTIMSWTQS